MDTANCAKGGEVNKKCSWNELKTIVNDLRRELAAISSMVPIQISFRTLSDGSTRIYYLVNTPDCWGIPLLYVDVPLNAKTVLEGSGLPRLSGRQAMGCLPEPGARRSREQRLLSERQRAPSWGAITSYHLHPAQPCIVFPMAGSLYMLRQTEGLSVPQPLTIGGGAALTPAMCPARAGLVAHAASGDIWLAGCSRKPVRLTYACQREPRLADDPKQAGVPCYVMQEEFSRYTGFWWQPVTNDNVYRIVYEEVDESDVKIYSFPSYSSPNGDIEEFRFPRTGSTNARSTLRLLEFTVTDGDSSAGESEGSSPGSDHLYDHWDLDNDVAKENEEPQFAIRDRRWFDLIRPLEDAFPWMEYIARVGWTPCGQYVWCQILDRRQQRLELVLIPLADFAEPFQYETGPSVKWPSPLGPEAQKLWIPAQVLVSERSPEAWVNVHDILHFLPSTDPWKVSFIWASEDTGHLHLYLITTTITGREDMISPSCVGPNIISRVPLTQGKWEVIGRKIWVDESRGLVYFMGLKETPLEKHLYCSSYHEPCAETPQLLTEPGYSFTIDMDEKCEVVVATYSNIRTQPTCRVYLVRHRATGPYLSGHGSLLEAAPTCMEPALNQYPDSPLFRLPGTGGKNRARYTPELYSMRLDSGMGEELHAMMFRPTGEPRKPCPTLLYVYGGPVVQTVTNTFKGMRQLRMHMAAARGYCVVCIDSRGSKHRGVQFEARIRGRMGTVELEDQIEVLKWLADETGCIDLSRVAVHGWSYGGYLSLMALAQHPSVFKVCVACAPVTSWEMYDTAYTERYMDLPSLNPAAYARGSVIKKADKFPDEENRLLIVHGLQDENVHFLHTQQLIDALVKAGKPYQLQVYPNERHSLRHIEASTHYEATLLSFLQNYL